MAAKAKIVITYDPDADLWNGSLTLEGKEYPTETQQDDDRDAVLSGLVDAFADRNGDEYPTKLTVLVE